MKTFLPLLFFVVCSSAFAQIEPTLYVGISSHHSNEEQYLETPFLEHFNQSIFSDPELFTNISEQLGGEIIEVLPYFENNLKNAPFFQGQLAYRFNSNWGIYTNLGWARNTHTQNFEIAYFDSESGIESIALGKFSSIRNLLQGTMGVSYQLSAKPQLRLNLGVVIRHGRYQAINASISTVYWEVSPTTSYTELGIRFSPEITFLNTKRFSFSFAPDVILANVNQQTSTYLGAYLGITLNTRKVNNVVQNEVVQLEESSTNNIQLSGYAEIKRAKNNVSNLEEEFEANKEVQDSLTELKVKTQSLYRQLVVIDSILDVYPNKATPIVNSILDSIAKTKNNENLAGAAQQTYADKVNDCEKKVADLEAQLAALNDCEDLAEAQRKLMVKLESAYLKYRAVTVEITLDEDNKIKVKIVGWVSSDAFDRYNTRANKKKVKKIKDELKEANKAYKECLEKAKKLHQEIQEVKKECEDLKEQQQNAKDEEVEAKNEQQRLQKVLDDWCKWIKDGMDTKLKAWCDTHPDLCDFGASIDDFLNRPYPTTKEGWEDFIDAFNEILSKKKQLEDELGTNVEDIEDGLSGLEDEKSELENDLDIAKGELENAKAKAATGAAKEKADAEAKAAAAKKTKADQKKKDNIIKDLIKRSKSDEAGDEAFKKLMKQLDLDILDEATGDLKLGKVIGGLLVLKDQPDCICPLLKALRDVIAASNRGHDALVWTYANEYIRLWKECANLPSLSTAMAGSDPLADAIKGMGKEQKKKALETLNNAIRIQCRN